MKEVTEGHPNEVFHFGTPKYKESSHSNANRSFQKQKKKKLQAFLLTHFESKVFFQLIFLTLTKNGKQ